MTAYRAYFKGFDRQHSNNPTGILYSVHFGQFSATTYTELKMAGSSPFVVNYNTSNTPFDPVRTSTATIRLLNPDYALDLFPSQAQQIPVYLYNEYEDIIEWCGFVTPKVYDGGYTECLEEIDIEAADCLSSLQYKDYVHSTSSGKAIVSVEQIVNNIVFSGTSQVIDKYYWYSKAKSGNSIYDKNVVPENYSLSEQNFYSSDTDEPWKMNEVLEEICRYFGYTAIQYGNNVYFIDYSIYKKYGKNVQVSIVEYTKQGQHNQQTLQGTSLELSSADIRASDASISIEPVYNKITVKANMYACERLLPSIFDDNLLKNRLDPDNFYARQELTVPDPKTPSYPYGAAFLGIGQNYHPDPNTDLGKESGDSVYSYYMRVYDHQSGWTSVYNSGDTTSRPTSQADLTTMPGATVVDLGVVRNTYTDPESRQLVMPSKLDFTRYLMINQHNNGYLNEYKKYPMYQLINYRNLCPFDEHDAFIVIKGSAIQTKYIERCYINPDWETNVIKAGGNASLFRSNIELVFSLAVGDKYWLRYGNSDAYGWVTGYTMFGTLLEKTGDSVDYSNTERKILNNVHYSMEVGEEGYMIPLSGLSSSAFTLTDNINMTIHVPTYQWRLNNEPHYNGFVWLKDFDIKLVNKGQDAENNEGDVVYENVIDGDAISELSEITCKITSYTSSVTPSFSSVMVNTTQGVRVSTGFTDTAANEARPGEMNIIQKYYDQYKQPVKKITQSIDNKKQGLRPWSRIYNFDPDNPNQMYVVLGGEIDYCEGTATITATELK